MLHISFSDKIKCVTYNSTDASLPVKCGGIPSASPRLLQSALDAAAAQGMQSIALCCISTGIYGFPADLASQIALHTVRF